MRQMKDEVSHELWPKRADRGQQTVRPSSTKILRGATPAEIPVEQVVRIEPVINLKTAQALELALPPVVLFQAEPR